MIDKADPSMAALPESDTALIKQINESNKILLQETRDSLCKFSIAFAESSNALKDIMFEQYHLANNRLSLDPEFYNIFIPFHREHSSCTTSSNYSISPEHILRIIILELVNDYVYPPSESNRTESCKLALTTLPMFFGIFCRREAQSRAVDSVRSEIRKDMNNQMAQHFNLSDLMGSLSTEESEKSDSRRRSSSSGRNSLKRPRLCNEHMEEGNNEDQFECADPDPNGIFDIYV